MAPISKPRCSVCNIEAPQPLLICFKCREGTDINGIITVTGYCGSKCRDSDNDHVKTCKTNNDRKHLYRAGDLLQAVFYEWQETAFQRNLGSVWKDEGYVCFEEDNDNLPEDYVHFPFPDSMFDNLQDKQKMLALDGCSDALVNMLELIRRAFRGLSNRIREVKVHVDPEHLAIHRFIGFDSDNQYFYHKVLGVNLGVAGENFVIDLAGAQHSQFKPVMSDTEYFLRSGVDDTQERYPLGNAASFRASKDNLERRPEVIDWYRVAAAMRPRFKATLDDWEASQGQTVSQLLRGSKGKYEEGKKILLRMVHDTIQKCVDDKGRKDYTVDEQAISDENETT